MTLCHWSATDSAAHTRDRSSGQRVRCSPCACSATQRAFRHARAGKPHGHGSFAFVVSRASHFVFHGTRAPHTQNAARALLPSSCLRRSRHTHLGLFRDGCPLRGVKRWNDGQVHRLPGCAASARVMRWSFADGRGVGVHGGAREGAMVRDDEQQRQRAGAGPVHRSVAHTANAAAPAYAAARCQSCCRKQPPAVS